MSSSKVSTSKAALEKGDVTKGAAGGKEKDNSSSDRPDCSSPEVAKCAICLGDVVNRSCSNSCVHQFCFGCLLEWSKVKPECPLCKSSFRSIYHNFRSNTEYDEYTVPAPPPAVPHFSIRFTTSAQDIMMVRDGELAATYGVDLSLMRDPFRDRRFIRVLGPGHQSSHSMNRNQGYDEIPTSHHHTIPFSLQHPVPPPTAHQPVPPPPVPSNPFSASTSGRPEFFGDISNEHRRTQEEAIQLPGYQNRRRRYDRDEWVEPFGAAIARGPVRVSSLEYIRSHPSAIVRLRTWLFRELSVLLGLHKSREELAFIYDLITHLLNHYDIHSREFREMTRTYFQHRTLHFQHELYNFLLSGLSVDEYDRVAEYQNPSISMLDRRNVIPEVITLDSDDETSQSREPAANDGVRESRQRQFNPNDIILLDSSSDNEDYARPPRQYLGDGGPSSESGSYAAATAGDGSSNSSNRSFGSIDFTEAFSAMPELGISSIGRREDVEGPQHSRSTRSNARNFIRDPSMPVLEPQVYPCNHLNSSNNVTIDRGRATAATSTISLPSPGSHHPISLSPELEMIHQNLTRPSVLSNSETSRANPSSNGNGRIRLLDAVAEFDLDLNVSVEHYTSPPREGSRPLVSPDFPILELRRNFLERERGASNFRSSSSPFANNSSRTSAWASLSSLGVNSTSRLSESGSAFVPYESHSSSSGEEITRPPRPSCIRRNSGGRNQLSSTSSSAPRSSSPAFRINLYPRGISSSQVMDLSRSAGLISSAPTTTTSGSATATVASTSPDPTPCCSRSSAFSRQAFNTSSLIPQANKSTPKEEKDAGPSDASGSDELECLGSFPIQKKPPLAVITLSSDSEDEGVKRENRNETTNIPSDEDTFDRFLMNWAAHELDEPEVQVSDLVPAISLRSPSSSSSAFPIAPHHHSTSSASGGGIPVVNVSNESPFKISIRNVTGHGSGGSGSFRLHPGIPSVTSSAASSQQGSPTSSNGRPSASSSHSHALRKTRGRKRIWSFSDESSENGVNENDARQSSSTSSAAKIPKKRKFVAPPASPVQTPPHFSTSDSDNSSENDDHDKDSDFEVKRSSKSKKRSSPSKKKHKSRTKKSKKSKRSKSKDKEKEKKDKEKGKRSKSRSRSGSKSKTETEKMNTSSTSTASTASSSNTNGGDTASNASSGKASTSKSRSKKNNKTNNSNNNSTAVSATATSAPSVQEASTLRNSSFLPINRFDYPGDLLDLSFNGRLVEEEILSPLRTQQYGADETIDLSLPPRPLSATVDVSAIFDTMCHTHSMFDVNSSSSSATERRGNDWKD